MFGDLLGKIPKQVSQKVSQKISKVEDTVRTARQTVDKGKRWYLFLLLLTLINTIGILYLIWTKN